MVVWKLVTGEDKALLVGKDAFLVLNLGLDGLARKSLDEDVHALSTG